MALSLSETRKVLEFVTSIPKAGKSAIFIDHNIFHVYPVVDRIVCLTAGESPANLPRRSHPGRAD